MSGDPYTIFMVEDDEVDVESARIELREAGIHNHLQIANDGLEALELLRSGGVRPPYVIFLDVNLPRMDGFEFLGALRADPALREAPVYVLSTSLAPRDVERAHSLGVSGYLSKDALAVELPRVAEALGTPWLSP